MELKTSTHQFPFIIMIENLQIHNSRHYLSSYFVTYICNIGNHMKESQGGFHNLFFLPLSFILVQGSIGKEPVRKPDVVANTSTFKYSFHKITFQIKFLLNPSQMLSSNIFKTSRSTRRTRAGPGWNNTTLKAIQAYTQTRFCTIDPNIGPD